MKRQIAIILIILTLGFSQKINLNSATLEELQILELAERGGDELNGERIYHHGHQKGEGDGRLGQGVLAQPSGPQHHQFAVHQQLVIGKQGCREQRDGKDDTKESG